MPWTEALWIYGCALAGCLIGGVGIGAAMGFVGILGVFLVSGISMWPTLASVVWNTMTDFNLVAIPLFVLMGEVILQCGIANRFYTGISGWCRHVPGGLAQTNIVGCAMFSAISGSSVATALTIGSVAVTEMRQRGYDDQLTFGTLTAGGSLGILIPPSIPLIVYGSMTQESVIDLFMAGIIPGLLLAFFFSIFVACKSALQPRLLPAKALKTPNWTTATAMRDVFPIVALIASVIGGMYFGLVTPTEAAGLGVLIALLISALYRKFTLKRIWVALKNSLFTSAVILFITLCAQILSYAVVSAGIGQGIAEGLLALSVPPLLFFCALVVVYLVLGAVVDGLSIMLLTVPLLYLPLRAMGFDGVWIGIILVIFIELGALTPPVGLNLFAIQSISPGAKIGAVARSSAPYCFILVAFAFLLYVFPEIVLWLPKTLK